MYFWSFYTILHEGKVQEWTLKYAHTTMHTNGFLFITE